MMTQASDLYGPTGRSDSIDNRFGAGNGPVAFQVHGLISSAPIATIQQNHQSPLKGQYQANVPSALHISSSLPSLAMVNPPHQLALNGGPSPYRSPQANRRSLEMGGAVPRSSMYRRSLENRATPDTTQILMPNREGGLSPVPSVHNVLPAALPYAQGNQPTAQDWRTAAMAGAGTYNSTPAAYESLRPNHNSNPSVHSNGSSSNGNITSLLSTINIGGFVGGDPNASVLKPGALSASSSGPTSKNGVTFAESAAGSPRNSPLLARRNPLGSGRASIDGPRTGRNSIDHQAMADYARARSSRDYSRPSIDLQAARRRSMGLASNAVAPAPPEDFIASIIENNGFPPPRKSASEPGFRAALKSAGVGVDLASPSSGEEYPPSSSKAKLSLWNRLRRFFNKNKYAVKLKRSTTFS